ncbi:MAG: phage tail terminator-like protein [Smithella sp.]
MSFVLIRQALETKLATLPNLPYVAYENTQYVPTTGTAFIRFTLVPNQNRAAAIGVNAPTNNFGLLFLDVFTPANTGSYSGDQIADDLINLFQAGTYLTVSDSDTTLQVRIRFSERAQTIFEPDWNQVPVQVSWYTYVPNNNEIF